MSDDGLRPDGAVSTVRRAVEESGHMPDKLNYLEHDPDVDGSDANIKLPLFTARPISQIRITDFNTDKVGLITDTDADGNEVVTGRVFNAEYRLDLQLDLWTASGSSYSEKDLGNRLFDALYQYDSHGPNGDFTDENGQPIEAVWKFTLGDGEPANDLTMTPSLRRWRQNVTLWAYNTFRTTEEYVTEVNVPDEITSVDVSSDDDDFDGIQFS